LRRRQNISGSAAEGVRAVFRNWGLLLRSSVIGTVVGFIPGIGGAVASFIAYGHAARSKRGGGPPFGEGNIRGILAPEAANDAKDGGSLIPTLAFGIPGNAATAVLLAVFTIHGITPGRAMLDDNLALVFALIWSLFLSNWLTSIAGLAMVNPLSRLGEVRGVLLAPVVFVLAMAGAYLQNDRWADVVVALVFGVFGFLLSLHGWPRVPLVMGLVLGGLFETNLLLTIRLQQLGRVQLWDRPIALALLALAAFSLLTAVRGLGSSWGAARVQYKAEPPKRGGARLAFTAVLLTIAGTFAYLTVELGPVARRVPAIVVSVLVVLLAAQLVLEWRSPRTHRGAAGDPE
jgi:putative tricarboxylic transport membrane protein